MRPEQLIGPEQGLEPQRPKWRKPRYPLPKDKADAEIQRTAICATASKLWAKKGSPEPRKVTHQKIANALQWTKYHNQKLTDEETRIINSALGELWDINWHHEVSGLTGEWRKTHQYFTPRNQQEQLALTPSK